MLEDAMELYSTGREDSGSEKIMVVIVELENTANNAKTVKNKSVQAELAQVLSIVSHLKTNIDNLLKENQELKEYKYKYEDLCK